MAVTQTAPSTDFMIDLPNCMSASQFAMDSSTPEMAVHFELRDRRESSKVAGDIKQSPGRMDRPWPQPRKELRRNEHLSSSVVVASMFPEGG